MADFLRWILGLKQAPEWVSDGSYAIQFHSLPQGLWAIGCVALAVAGLAGIWFLYRSETSNVGRATRLALVVLRSLVLTCVAFMLLELVLVITKHESIPSRLVVLLDTSESMGLNDPYPDDEAQSQLAARLGDDGATALRKSPRLELATRAVGKVLDQLADGREVSIYGFSQQLTPLTRDEFAAAQPQGSETAIGNALTTALAEHRGQPLAGVLVISDGQSNAGEDPRKAAEPFGKQSVPIVALAIGTEEGPSNCAAGRDRGRPDRVCQRSNRNRRAYRRARHEEPRRRRHARKAARRRLGRNRPRGSILRRRHRLAPRDLQAHARNDWRDGAASTGVGFGNRADRSRQRGRAPDESRAAADPRAVDRRAPSPEVQFLRNALLRDTGLEFACWLQTAGNGYEQMGTRPIRRLPANRQELEQFDVLVLFDPDMRALGPAWPELIAQFVGTAGGGLVYVAGEVHTRNLFDGVVSDGGGAGGSTVDNSWLRTLPVVADPGLFKSNAEVALSAREPWNLELTPEGSSDQIFQFASDNGRNREILASLPGMYWHFPVTRAKPGATVLARHGDPRMRNSFGRNVLLAMHRYGPGRSVFLAFDSTYRWRYLHEEYFDGFWARLIDRVGRGKALGGRYPFTLTTDKASYRTGERVTVRARALDSAEGVGVVADLKGEVELAGQTATPLEMEPLADQVGVAETTFVANEAGTYTVRILPGNAGAQGDPSIRPATINLRVDAAHSELDRPKLDRGLLEDVARASGGSVLALADYERIPTAFKVKQVGRLLEYRDELWDAPLLFGGLMVLLTTEWILRKRSRMA